MSEKFDSKGYVPRFKPDCFGWSQRCVDGTVVVHLAGELDLSTAEELGRRLMAVVESAADTPIVLDLSDVSFIDARSIGLIVGAWSAAKSRGRQLCVDGLHGIPARLFGLLGLERILAARTLATSQGG